MEGDITIEIKHIWVLSEFLGLETPLKKDWMHYTISLQRESIVLTLEDDTLVWSWNIDFGIPTTKMVYESLIHT